MKKPRIFRRSAENPSASLANPANWFKEIFDAFTSISGAAVNENTALTFSAVYGCVKILSEAISSLPLLIIEENGDGRSVAKDHPLYILLHKEPSNLYNSFTWRETLMIHLLLHGNAFSKIIRSNGEAKELEIIKPQDVTAFKEGNELAYKVKKDEGKSIEEVVKQQDMLHIPGLSFDGLYGKSPLKMAKESIGGGLTLQEFGNRFFADGATVSGVLSHPGKLTKTSLERLKDSWDQYVGSKKAHKTAILEEGLKYEKISIPPEEAQFLQSRKFSIEEVARWYRVPPHMLAQLERATFRNMEQQSLEFVLYTLIPWIKRWEMELDRKLFIAKEDKIKYFTKFNVDGLLRGDVKTRAEFYKNLFAIGSISPNEVRARENMNPIADGDKFYVPMNVTDTKNLEQNQ